MKFHLLILATIWFILFSCGQVPGQPKIKKTITSQTDEITPKNKQGVKTIHVFVALCDNKYQGIIPVPSKIGNGQEPFNNLYWGAGFGVKTFFTKKDSEWKLLKDEKSTSDTILERLLFKHKTKDIYMLADAYNGRYIRQTTIDFFNAAAARQPCTMINNTDSIYFCGASDLVVYIGHDGLMDFTLDNEFENESGEKKDAIMLACYSKKYFSPFLEQTKADPIVWSTGLMAPEAYVLYSALEEWSKGKTNSEIATAAARAYAKYQNCSFSAANRLLINN